MGQDDLALVPYILICTVVLLLLTTFLLKAYAHISLPNHARWIVWLSWTLCFSIVYILPLDLRPHVGNNDAMYPFYVILYWFCFFLTWILTPFQSAYIKSGGFDTKERLIDAVKLSALFFIIVGIVAVIAFVYLLLATSLGASQLGAVLQAFGNLWGLSFAIMTMGYGLVEIPRYFWYKSNYDRRLQYLYFKLAQCEQNKENARDRVDELLYLYKKCRAKYESLFVYEFAKMDEIIAAAAQLQRQKEIKASHLDITFDEIDDAIASGFKRKHLRKMHMLFKIWLFQLERTNLMWRKMISDIFYFEEMTNYTNKASEYQQVAQTSLSTESQSPAQESLNHSHAATNMDHIREKWSICERVYWITLPVLSKSIAVLLSIFSLMIIWSEAMIIFDYCGVEPYLSVFALINMAQPSIDSVFSILFGVMLFCYLSSCSLFALWRIHINRDYHMHPFQLTDGGSLLTNAAFCMRFMFPLGYNFLLLNIEKKARDSHKEEYPYLFLFHDMSVLPVIGDPINVFLPMLVLLFCAATYANLYAKLMKKLRISRFEFGDPNQSGNQEIREWIKEGRVIARKFKKELMHNEAKKREFIHFIHCKFNTKWLRNNRWTESTLNLQENIQLINDEKIQSNIRKVAISKDNNNNNNKIKHQFIEIELQQDSK